MRISTLRALVSIAIGLALCAGVATNTALGVVTFSDGSNEDPPWFANVGTRGTASGIYLGDGWVLTAKHIGAGNIDFSGVTYHCEAGSVHPIENPPGYYRLNSTYTDLVLFRLTEEPDLPSLTIAAAPPSVGSELYLAGNGIEHEDALSYWTVNTNGWTWTETETATSYWGFKPEGGCQLNWGTNRVMGNYGGPSSSTCYWSLPGIDMVAMKTRFDSQESYEAQAVVGDSGGGAFYYDNDEGWVLAGIISNIDTLPNAPTKAIAGALTYSVDLSFYHDQILDIIASETKPPPYLPGDINGDQIVNSSDVTILAMHWGETTTEGVSFGDLNGDGLVDGSDGTILANNWMKTSADVCQTESDMEPQLCTLPAQTAISEIPEPATWVLLLFLGIGSLGWNTLRKICRCQ